MENNQRPGESPVVEIEGVNFYPYVNKRDAEKDAKQYSDDFADIGEKFKAISLGDGYVIKSQSIIFDSRGHAADKQAPLEKLVRAFKKISELT